MCSDFKKYPRIHPEILCSWDRSNIFEAWGGGLFWYLGLLSYLDEKARYDVCKDIWERVYQAFAFEIGLFTVRQEDKCKNFSGTWLSVNCLEKPGLKTSVVTISPRIDLCIGCPVMLSV